MHSLASPGVVIKAAPVAVKERRLIVLPSRVPHFDGPPTLTVDVRTGQVVVNRLADVMGQAFGTKKGE
jgi:hypothetical protein